MCSTGRALSLLRLSRSPPKPRRRLADDQGSRLDGCLAAFKQYTPPNLSSGTGHSDVVRFSLRQTITKTPQRWWTVESDITCTDGLILKGFVNGSESLDALYTVSLEIFDPNNLKSRGLLAPFKRLFDHRDESERQFEVLSDARRATVTLDLTNPAVDPAPEDEMLESAAHFHIFEKVELAYPSPPIEEIDLVDCLSVFVKWRREPEKILAHFGTTIPAR